MRRSGLPMAPLALGAAVVVLPMLLIGGPARGTVSVALLLGAATAVVLVLRWPVLGLHAILVAAFVSMGVKRAFPSLPMGLSVDGLIVVCFVAVMLRPNSLERTSRLQDVGVLPLVIWMGWCLSQLLNPESPSAVAWFYAVRGIAGYMVVPLLVVLILDSKRQLIGLVLHWAVWANLAALWGMKQLHMGLEPFEQRWMNAGAYQTHMLHGKLRVFSFLSDTAQFGITMAFSFLFFALLATGKMSLRIRMACATTAALCFYGCMISGTRSAWVVVPVGVLVFAIIRRRWGPTLLGLGAILLAFCVLRFTFIGQSNYHIQRMRQVTRPFDDPSFQVRLENQRKLFPYLMVRPFGGGIGSAGFWGQRFSPGTFLANIPMDSHYVRIASELGPLGFLVFFLTMTGLGFVGISRSPQIRDPTARLIYDAHMAVFFGVFVASYSNQYLAQIPTAVVVYQGFALIIVGPRMFREPPASAPVPARRPRFWRLLPPSPNQTAET